MKFTEFKRLGNSLMVASFVAVISACGSTPNAPATPVESAKKVESKVSLKNEIDLLLANAYKQIEDGNLSGAEESLTEARQKDQDNVWVALDLGVVYQRTGREGLAIVEYNKVLAADDEALKAGKEPLYAYWRNRMASIASSNLAMIKNKTDLAPRAVMPSAIDAETVAKAVVFATVSAWRSAWASRNAEAYFDLYVPGYSAQEENAEKWRRKRMSVFEKAGEVHLTIDSPLVAIDSSNHARVSFKQIYSNQSSSESGQKTLYMRKVGDRWLIEKEVFGR